MSEPAEKLPPAVLAPEAAEAKPTAKARPKPAPETLYQVHLSAQHMCGRGVRFRIIPPELHEKAELTGAEVAGRDATLLQLRECQIRECLYVMIREITEKPGLGTLQAEGIVWKEVNGAYLMNHWSDLFGAKDIEMLKRIYSHYHEVTAQEHMAILGKVLPVSGE